jgi:hypothetical protein
MSVLTRPGVLLGSMGYIAPERVLGDLWGRWTATGLTQAIEHFERAIDRDPSFALAWSGLGEALVVAGYYGFIAPADAMARGLRAARRAIDIDQRLANRMHP